MMVVRMSVGVSNGHTRDRTFTFFYNGWLFARPRNITHGLRAMMRRRNAIEPVIGRRRADGKLDQKWIKEYWVGRHTQRCAALAKICA
ncbi:hypothetical protein M3S_J66 [Sorghum bicolor]|nr:hypothetical protein M3S_J66 [Sorghum bicolor]